jgi:ketosteroid isomerase-like protein
MSQENVEVVRATIDAWNAGDMDAFRELHDPEVIAQTVENWPERGPYVGREAVMRGFESIREAWDADGLEPISDFIDAADRVVVRFAWRGRGPRPRREHRADLRGNGAQGQDPLHRVLLGSRGSPRSRRAVGVAMSRENVEIVRT